jgi:hypothetical protein
MKTLSCDQCETEFSAADFMMKNATATPADIAKWFADARARFDAA